MSDDNLLVAVDGSANGDRAVAYAISLVQRGFAARLHLLNVQPDASRRDEGSKALHSAQSLCAQASVPSESHLDAGRPGAVIVERAQELSCDSIIIGTRGQTAIADILLGSVAQDVVKRGEMPVWLVK